MHHFTSTAYIVTAMMSGRHGQYGATSSVVGIFNTEARAEDARQKFMKNYAHDYGIRDMAYLDRCIKVARMKIGCVDEQIIGKCYE